MSDPIWKHIAELSGFVWHVHTVKDANTTCHGGSDSLELALDLAAVIPDALAIQWPDPLEDCPYRPIPGVTMVGVVA